MELGLDFDDKDFIEEKKTSVNECRLKSYNAKVCDPLVSSDIEKSSKSQ